MWKPEGKEGREGKQKRGQEINIKGFQFMDQKQLY